MAETLVPTIKITVSQPHLHIDGTVDGYPTQTSIITFGHWFKGDKGDDGKSAYEIWLEEGHTGTEEDYLDWLKADCVQSDWEQNDPTAKDYIKNKPSGIGVEYGTTAYWNSRIGYIPTAGKIIVYSDKDSKTVGNKTVYIPGIKIGSGNGYVQDLAFVADEVADDLLAHINNTSIHVTSLEKVLWNNKMNVNDLQEVVDETLIFNRN